MNKETDLDLTETEAVDRYASQCVKCALCLPFCPTYKLAQDENESPRGRIALFQALAQKKLPLTAKAQQHLDQCLGCRACESVCPAHVEYGALLTHGRALLKKLPHKEPLPRPSATRTFISWLVTKPKLQYYMHQLLWGVQITGLRRLARLLQLPRLLGLQLADEILPSVAKPHSFSESYEPIGSWRGTVRLFSGCMSRWCDQETLMASIFVLRQLGYKVILPLQQTCCGAIALHEGSSEQAQILAQQNHLAFKSPEQIGPIITLATGCSTVLQAYDQHFSSQSNSKEFNTFSGKVIDIVDFIQQCEWPADIIPKALPLKVLLHTPCTRRYVLKSPFYPEQLLARIPELTWQSFQSNDCCGAAGTYFLDHPAQATLLGQKLLSEIDNIQVNHLVTTNIGCALHLRRQLKKNHLSITVSHPVTLLARSLGF